MFSWSKRDGRIAISNRLQSSFFLYSLRKSNLLDYGHEKETSSVEEYKPMTNSNFTTLRDGARKVDLCIASKTLKDGEREEKKANNCKTFYENWDQAGLQLEHAKVDKTSVCPY